MKSDAQTASSSRPSVGATVAPVAETPGAVAPVDETLGAEAPVVPSSTPAFRNSYIIPSFPTREQHARSVQNARSRFNKLNQSYSC